MKVNLSKIVLKDINGVPVKKDPDENIGVHTAVANLLYTKAKNVDLVDIAIQMNRGDAVELTPSHIAEIKKLIPDGLATFARKAVLEFLDEAKSKNKNWL